MKIIEKILLSIFIIFFINFQKTLQNPINGQNYTSEILRLAKAAHIKAYMNVEKDPCSNFYKFSCGNWQRLHPAKDDVQKTAYLDQLHELYIKKSEDMLKTELKIDTQTDIKLKDFYNSCRNRPTAVYDDLLPIFKIVGYTWPKLEHEVWFENEYDWLKLVAQIRRLLGIDILIGLSITPDFEVKDVQRIMIGAPKFGLGFKNAYVGRDYKDLRFEYKRNIATKLISLFGNDYIDWANSIAEQVLTIEQQLAKGLPDNPALTLLQTTRLRYTGELKAAYGNYVDLSRYINLIFNETIYSQVYETPEDYLSNLVEVIKLTPKNTIANYTLWRILDSLDIPGETDGKFLEHWCIQKVVNFFPLQLETMFNRHFNSMQSINEVRSVWSDIKKTFRDDLQQQKRLFGITANTLQKAIVKLDAIDLEIITHANENFEVQMRTLKIQKDTYYENLINILQWRTKHDLAKLITSEQLNEIEDIKLPKYQLNRNKILIPITFLQSRFFFDKEYPQSLKYATLGFILAKEMLHGFDAIGRKYDNHGYQRAWWDNESEYAYDQRAKCFEKQYNGNKFQGREINDPNLISTAVTDNGGLAIAYRAYDNWWRNVANIDLSAMEILPLLNYTQTQIFFIGYAQTWCADYQRQENDGKFTTLPEQLRVNGALINQNIFAHEFHCEMGSRMNIENKCVIY